VNSPGLAGQADALWTRSPGLGVIGRSADCPLILLTGTDEKGGRLAGFAHASWRSTVRGISAALAWTLLKEGVRPASMLAVICPSAGPCCYEVGDEVRSEATLRLGEGAAAHFKRQGDRQVLDLWAANTEQLVRAGLTPGRIFNAGHCTICGGPASDLRYASYRRQGLQAGRFAAVVGFSG
jgi:YfiH family protein